MWWKRNKWKIITSALILVMLAALWYGTLTQDQRVIGPETHVAATASPTIPPTLSVRPSQPSSTSPSAAQSAATSSPLPVEQTAPAPLSPPPSSEEVPSPANVSDAVPSELPPTESEDTAAPEGTYYCTLSISCAALLDHMDQLGAGKAELVPEDGWILRPTEAVLYEGESVFNVLQRVCKQNKIHLDSTDIARGGIAYIKGIGNLYESDCGELSGWTYQVNGQSPNYSCSLYALQDGDEICWSYTCDLGADMDGFDSAGNQP